MKDKVFLPELLIPYQSVLPEEKDKNTGEE